jgi:RecA/RadA recombinase
MAKEKVKSIADLLSEYKTTPTTECIEVTPDVLNILWGGGIRPGSLMSIWGEAGCGKSSIALQVARSFCKEGKKVWFLDSECALNARQLESFGLSNFAEDGLFTILDVTDYKQLENVVRSIDNAEEDDDKIPKLIVLDSESMLVPYYSDRTASVEDHQPGVKARQAGIVLPYLKRVIKAKGISVVMVLHARANLNMVGAFGPEDKAAGGYVLYHIADVRTKMSVSSKIYENPADKDSRVIGCNARITTEKNKFASPRVEFTFPLIYGQGISNKHYAVKAGLDLGIITQSGAMYTMPGDIKVRGQAGLFTQDVEVYKELFKQVHRAYYLQYLEREP